MPDNSRYIDPDKKATINTQSLTPAFHQTLPSIFNPDGTLDPKAGDMGQIDPEDYNKNNFPPEKRPGMFDGGPRRI